MEESSEESSLNPNLSSGGRKRPSFKKKKSSFSSSSKKTLKKGILGLSINSRIARFKSKLNKNDSVSPKSLLSCGISLLIHLIF